MDLDCRVAKLEQRVDGLCRELNEDKAYSSKMIEEIFNKLNSILEAQSKQRGFWSGVVFVISGITTLIGLTFAVADKGWFK
jgi:hypothetical protein